MFEIEEINKNEINNNHIDLNTLSNCSLQSFSNFNEYEVLFFPLSCFEVISIKKENEEYYKINLKNLGRHGSLIRKQLGNDFFKKINLTKFSEDLIDAKITKNKDFMSSWMINKRFKGNYTISFMLDDYDFVLYKDNSISIISLLKEKKN